MANESANVASALPSVNLLPYHAERRAGKRKKVFISLAAAAAAGAVVVLAGGMVIDHQTEEAQRINDILTQKNAEMNAATKPTAKTERSSADSSARDLYIS